MDARQRRRSFGTGKILRLSALVLITLLASGYRYAAPTPSRRAGSSPGTAAAYDVRPCDGRTNPRGKTRGVATHCLEPGSSSGIAKGDFNGDGFADLAVGVPGEDTPRTQPDSGAVVVIYGSSDGLTATTPGVPASQFWSQNSPGIPGSSNAGDRFGSALASGDFDGDRFSDLAIGIPNDDTFVGAFESTGRVVIIYGSSSGLTTSTASGVPAAQSFSLGNVNKPSDVIGIGLNVGSSFGTALAWGDFDGDGFGDLAIGDPRLKLQGGLTGGKDISPGAVCVLYGSEDGLTSARNQVWLQREIIGKANDGDLFGASLVGGDFNRDARTDLAIGAPGMGNASGGVYVLLGSFSGLTDSGALFLNKDIGGHDDGAAPGDRFGWSLAAADFDGDQRAELAVGVPFDDLGRASDAGSVQVFFGTGSGLDVNASVILTQSSVFETSSVQESGDHFGFALAAGNFNGDEDFDLAIGVPFEDLINTIDAGEVDVIYGEEGGGPSPAAGPGSQSWHQSFAGITTLAGDAEARDRFGLTLTAWNFGRNLRSRDNPLKVFTFADLAVGVPFEGLISPTDGVTPLPSAGAVNVIYGSPNGLTLEGNDLWTQDDPGVPGAAEPGDTFGMGLY